MFHFDLKIDHHLDHRAALKPDYILTVNPWVIRIAMAFGWKPNLSERSLSLLRHDENMPAELIALALNRGPEHHAFVAALHLAMQALETSPHDRQAYMSVKAGECTRTCHASEFAARGDSLHRLTPRLIEIFLEPAVQRMH
jgi:hypothetical protein